MLCGDNESLYWGIIAPLYLCCGGAADDIGSGGLSEAPFRQAAERLGKMAESGILKKNDKHETEALINGQTGEEIHLDHRSNLFFLLMRMQDEVHRFAISSFRKKHQKSLFQTIYDDIPGIGKKRKAMLLSAYPTLESIKDASIEELTQFIPRESAEILKDKIKRGLN